MKPFISVTISCLLSVTLLTHKVYGNCMSSNGFNFKEHPSVYLNGLPFVSLTIMHSFECLLACENNLRCNSLNIKQKRKHETVCELLSDDITTSKLLPSSNSTHYQLIWTTPQTDDAKAVTYCHPECRFAKSCEKDLAYSCRCLKGEMLSLNNAGYVMIGSSMNQFAGIKIDVPSGKYKIKLIAITGFLSCGETDYRVLNNFGCMSLGGRNEIMMVITDKNNTALLPGSNGYSHDGRVSKSAFLTFNDPIELKKGQEIRLWYKEDLENAGDDDNSGQSFMNVVAIKTDD